MCFGLGILSTILGTKGTSKAQAKQAAEEARQSRLAAQSAQIQKEATINQDKATQAAEALLSKPIDPVEVQVGEPVTDTTDPTTGRKRTPRSSFQINAPASGLAL